MDKIRPMPENEKFQHAFEMVNYYQKNVLPFVDEQLGFEAMHKLRSIWQAGVAPVRQTDSFHDKYESAYSTWLWIARCSHDLLADELAKDEVLKYKRLLLAFYLSRKSQPTESIKNFLGFHSSAADALLYEMQWMTPIEKIGSTNGEVTAVVSNCRILNTPVCTRVCLVDCRHIGTAYARSVHHLKRTTEVNNHGCQITLTPL